MTPGNPKTQDFVRGPAFHSGQTHKLEMQSLGKNTRMQGARNPEEGVYFSVSPGDQG